MNKWNMRDWPNSLMALVVQSQQGMKVKPRHSFIHSFIHSFVHSFTRSFIYPFIRSFLCTFTLFSRYPQNTSLHDNSNAHFTLHGLNTSAGTRWWPIPATPGGTVKRKAVASRLDCAFLLLETSKVTTIARLPLREKEKKKGILSCREICREDRGSENR